MIERIKQIIEDEQLKKNCNRPEKVYRRWFFYCYLRNQKFYLREIAEIFDKHHATIIHGIKQAEFFEKEKDQLYFLHTKDLFQEFNDKTLFFNKRNLIEDIQNAKNFQDLSKIKRRINQNIYTRDDA
jgi:hypothetical protein